MNMSTNRADTVTIAQIAARFRTMMVRFYGEGQAPDIIDVAMDLTAVHANGMPLELERLLSTDDSNFAHDVGGIRRHLNRNTGQLGGCFLPRFAQKQAAHANG